MEAWTEFSIMTDTRYAVFRKCTPAWSMPKQRLSICDITYLVQGRAVYIINGTEYNVKEGDMICLPPYTVREGSTFPGQLMHCFSVDFQLKNMEGRNIQLPFPLINHIGLQKDLINLFHELNFTWIDKQPWYPLKTNAILLQIIHRFYELLMVTDGNTTVMDHRIKKVTRHIANHFSEKISVKEMSGMVGLNPAYFGTLFHQETGITMNQYLIRTRIRNAENMLKSGEYKVMEAAESCGYSDLIHFFKQFKAVIGIAPSQCIPKRAGGG
ncbi:hypothetical protein AGMMS49991_11460 [Spirochaetia bacterium]|nr:hypothetical protein AGMMS49991_11460 [Spirochaetia bacterium]